MIDEVTLEMVLLQLIPFLLTVFGLNAIILKPMLAHLAERERNIAGFKTEADALQDEVAAKVGGEPRERVGGDELEHGQSFSIVPSARRQ